MTAGDAGDTELFPNSLSHHGVVLTALPIEPWVRSVAEAYNATNPPLDGPHHVEIILWMG